MKKIIFTKQTIIFALIITIALLLAAVLVAQNTWRTTETILKKTSASKSSTITWESTSPNNSTTVFLVINTDKFVSVNNDSTIGMFEKYSMYSYSHKDSKTTHLATNGSLVHDESVRLEPISWLNNNELLVWAIETPIENPRGVFVLSTQSNRITTLPINKRIVSKPLSFDNNSKLFYYVLTGSNPVNMEFITDKKDLYVFDLEKDIEYKVDIVPSDVQKYYDELNNETITHSS